MKTIPNPSFALATAGWLAFTTIAAAGITSYLNQPDWLAAAGGTNSLTVFSFQGPTETDGKFANDPTIVPSYQSQGVVFLPFTGTGVFPQIHRGQQYQISAPNHDGLLANNSSPNPTSDLEGRAIKFDFNVCVKSVGANFNGPLEGGDYGHLEAFDANGNLIGQTSDCVAGGFVGLVSDTPIAEVHVVNTGNADITFGIWDLQFARLSGPVPPRLNGSYANGRLVYDPNTDLTWFQPPYATMNWYDALNWATNLNISGVTGWQLPSIAPATINYDTVVGNQDDGELAHLWYDSLGNHAGALTNSGPFDGSLWSTTAYWTTCGPVYAHLSGFAVYFSVGDGGYGLTTIPPWTPGLLPAMAFCAGNVGPTGLISTPVHPQISLARLSGGLVASWPSFPGGWQLQQCDDLAIGNWSDCTNAVSDDGTNYSVTIFPSAGNLFLRLAK